MRNVLNEELELLRIVSSDDGMGGFILETRNLGMIWAKVLCEEVSRDSRALRVIVRPEHNFCPEYYLGYEGQKYRVAKVIKTPKNTRYIELIAYAGK